MITSVHAGVLVAALIAITSLTACHRDKARSFQGTLEVVDVDVAPLVPARVVRVWRQEGDAVRVGDTLVTLTQATLSADIAARQAQLAAAQAQLRDLEAGARQSEIAQAESQLNAAEAEATRTAQDLARLTPLAASATISAQQLDAAQTAARTAAARRDAARDALRQLREGARPDQIAAARAAVNNARAALAAAQQTAADLVLRAPVSGTVISRHTEPGEVLAAGASAMTIGDVSRPYVRVYVDQSVLPGIKVGQVAIAKLDAYPDRAFEGHVVSINDKAEFTPRVALTRDERADLMFGVKIEFVNTTGMLKAGLPVTVTFAPVSETESDDGGGATSARGGARR